MTEKKSPVSILRVFFGLLPNETLQEFLNEVKQLTRGEKIELARLAAVELGCEVDETK